MPMMRTLIQTTTERGGSYSVYLLTALALLPCILILATGSSVMTQSGAVADGFAAWVNDVAALGCIVPFVVIFLVRRHYQVQQRLDATSTELTQQRWSAGREATDQFTAFGMALDGMNEGLLMFDLDNRLLLANAAMARIFKLEPGQLHPAMPIEDVIDAIVGAENISDQRVPTIDFYLQLVGQNHPAKFIRQLADGRYLAGNFTPNDSGWIITYEDMTEIRKVDERVAHMAMHDALTGLPNRIMLRIRIEEALAAIQSGGSFAILCLDLDHFKDVNDTLGHSAGDQLLCEVVKRTRSVVRPSDLVARLGGDEFAVVLNGIGSRTAVASMATRLVEAIGTPYELCSQAVFVGASIGIAMATIDGHDPDTLMKNADLALYRAKSAGRGRFAFFEPDMQQDVIERHRIGRELRNALLGGQLDLYYQPIVKVRNRRIIGFEALMRWYHPVRGLVPPLDFIPIAEANGFIVQLGKWALNRACQEAMQWPDELKIAVNLSPVQFRSGSLLQTVKEALEASGMAASRLELEITESTMMIDTDATLATLRQLKEIGVRIAMDDFGTGYSSLAYLQKFPFDKIKIDRAFIHDITHVTNLAIVRAVTGIAESLDIVTTAEGVETEDQFAAVASGRCNEVQGYLFSQPCAASEIASLLACNDPPFRNSTSTLRALAEVYVVPMLPD